MELTAWTYFLLLAIVKNPLFFIILIISVLFLALFNYPGDKKIDGPINVHGWLRIANEWVSGGLLGIIGAFLLFQELGALIQSLLVILVIIFDRERYAWMLGFVDQPPIYVSNLRL